jgi:hypothetical protein
MADILPILDETRQRYSKIASGLPSNVMLYLDSSDDVPDLLAAVEAVLELAAEFDAEDGHAADEAKLVGHPISRGDRLREAIFRALAARRTPMPDTIPRPRSNLPGRGTGPHHAKAREEI